MTRLIFRLSASTWAESECPASLYLQESEDFLDEAGDVHLAAQVASCRWGLHTNASRNARIRQVEWQELQLALEVGCKWHQVHSFWLLLRLPAAPMCACLTEVSHAFAAAA